MKKALLFGLMFLLVLSIGACSGGKQSAVEGKVVDWRGNPVAGVKITASQIQPIKGYEQFEAVTGADGTFGIKGLFPSSTYLLRPLSEKWTTETALTVDSAPQGETAVLPKPMKIILAYSKNGGSLVYDLSTGRTRFTTSSDGAITDSKTGLEWVTGPDQDTNYSQAVQWVAACRVAGGGWRMPTRAELKTLYLPNVGKWNLDPAFKTGSGLVWAEPNESKTFAGKAYAAWMVFFGAAPGYSSDGKLEEMWQDREGSRGTRVLGVRSSR